MTMNESEQNKQSTETVTSKEFRSKKKHRTFPGRFQNRSFGRLLTVQLLYQEEMNPGSSDTFDEAFIFNEDIPREKPLTANDLTELKSFVQRMFHGTRENIEVIDRQLENIAVHWSIQRMTPVDRNILRLAVYEMLYEQTPRAVAIHEAMEIAKKLGTENSTAFINGILDKIVTE